MLKLKYFQVEADGYRDESLKHLSVEEADKVREFYAAIEFGELSARRLMAGVEWTTVQSLIQAKVLWIYANFVQKPL
jgi:hypothetical protein